MARWRKASSLLRHLLAAFSRRVKDQRFQSRLQFGSALGIAVGLFLSLVLLGEILGTAPSRISDSFYQAPPPSNQVVIVAIDDKSIKQIGNLPWSRSRIEALFGAVVKAQPRVIGLDVVVGDLSIQEGALTQALQTAPNVVLPVVGVDATRFPASPGSFPRYGMTFHPYPSFHAEGIRSGQSIITPDADGIVRRVPLAIEATGQIVPALGIVVLELYTNQSLGTSIEDGGVLFGAERLPTDNQGQMQLSFFAASPQRVMSAADLLSNRANLAILRDKIVLIGMTSSTTPTRYETPLSNRTASTAITIQADLIDTILTHRLLVAQDRLTQVVMVFLLAILAGATLPHVRFLTATALTIIYSLLYNGYAFAKFDEGIVVQPLYPILALVLTFLGSVIYRYFSEERQRAFITRLVRRYVSPEDVDPLTDKFDHGSIPLGGIRREVSVLAIDLTELEPLSSSLSPSALVELLNQYASLVVSGIFRNNGSMVKHSGSALLAAWNLLIDQPDHARVAVRAAEEIGQQITEFNRRQPKELTINIGLGIATGSVIAGRIGASSSAEFAIVGEIVGLAERIALKPERGVFIDQSTRERIGDEFDWREVRPVRLLQKTDPSRVWHLVTLTEPETQATDQVDMAT